MSLERITEEELKDSGYNIRGQIGLAYKFQNGSNFLFAEKYKDNYEIKAWYYDSDKKFTRNTVGIQRRMNFNYQDLQKRKVYK